MVYLLFSLPTFSRLKEHSHKIDEGKKSEKESLSSFLNLAVLYSSDFCEIDMFVSKNCAVLISIDCGNFFFGSN